MVTNTIVFWTLHIKGCKRWNISDFTYYMFLHHIWLIESWNMSLIEANSWRKVYFRMLMIKIWHYWHLTWKLTYQYIDTKSVLGLEFVSNSIFLSNGDSRNLDILLQIQSKTKLGSPMLVIVCSLILHSSFSFIENLITWIYRYRDIAILL